MRVLVAALIVCACICSSADARARHYPVAPVQPGSLASLFGGFAVDSSDGIHGAVTAAAIAAGVPVNIAHAVVRMESGYNPRARSSSGAIGIMQVLPRTAAAMGENPYSVDGNLRAGMKYLALALRTSPNLCAAISGYNRGIAARPVCTDYGRRVLAMAGR